MKGFRHLVQTALSAVCLATTAIAPAAIFPDSVQATEEIVILVDGPILFSLAIADLETFATTGEITGSLKPYARFLNDETLQLLRLGLSFKLPLDVVTVDHLAYSPLGRDTLYNLGKVVQVQRGINGQKGLRAAFIGAAAKADASGWTMLDVLQEFPTPSLEIELQDLLALRRELSVYVTYNDAVVKAIKGQAQAEASEQTAIDVAGLRDLSQPGSYTFKKTTITVRNPAVRQTQEGLSVAYDFDADVYVPDGLTAPAPVVIISHGFGDVKESFTFIAEHIASYGYIAIVPDHVGSDLQYREEFLDGRLNTLLSPMEFINRPQEISFLIDELERLVAESPQWAALVDLESIGMTGDSLGTSTALAIAGAEINYARLVENCDQENLILNFALYLQCRARYLPPQNYDLKDPRVKAIVAGHPVGGALYGPEGFSEIDVPLLMVSGSKDIVSTVVPEQFHPFIWLQTESKYLALLDVGTHFSSKPGRDAAGGFFKLIAGEHRDVGSAYYKALTVAFWNVYLRGQESFSPYLTARYADFISEGKPMDLSIITALTPTQIEQAYGRRVPIPIIPPPIAAAVSPRATSILEEIKETGVLKVALRQDAAPFGFINERNAWDGYCGDFAIALSRYLTEALALPVEVQLAELTSNLDNRFELVQSGSVHLECGPNSIRNDVAGVSFSNPIFISSTQFLVPKGQEERVNPNTPLAGFRLGVLDNTTTQVFMEERYPDADIRVFSGPEGRKEGVQAAALGEIDAFVSDGILSYAELVLQGQTVSDYSFIPEVPLTCEFYGLILPNDDREWRSFINQFIVSEAENAVAAEWFEELYPQTLNKAAYCLNQ